MSCRVVSHRFDDAPSGSKTPLLLERGPMLLQRRKNNDFHVAGLCTNSQPARSHVTVGLPQDTSAIPLPIKSRLASV
jgi:hypothetical protein